MSASLQWSIIRNNSSFLVKNLGNTFTKEPNNLTGKNAFKYNGLVNKKVVGIEASSDGKGVILVTKKKRGHNKPGSNLVSTKLSCNSRATLKCIRNACGKSHYRSDLEDAAVRRAAALLRSQRPTAVVQKRRTRKKQT
ncbi:60S ribosomal protein L28-like [Xenia sp. Carnegie-2017]|uniref:60S ribosomal protein L28-like n=1 Tax=Xenia sp. Carnegie-2017 TaxID=2897299 RepID=UPI001F044D6D|nr:60S ribosomal protein L28-like [Xenia sp. Carnegie-2017]